MDPAPLPPEAVDPALMTYALDSGQFEFLVVVACVVILLLAANLVSGWGK